MLIILMFVSVFPLTTLAMDNYKIDNSNVRVNYINDFTIDITTENESNRIFIIENNEIRKIIIKNLNTNQENYITYNINNFELYSSYTNNTYVESQFD